MVKVPTKEVDKTNLLKIIKENEKHQEKDYTASSWKAVINTQIKLQTMDKERISVDAEADQANTEQRSSQKHKEKQTQHKENQTNTWKNNQ